MENWVYTLLFIFSILVVVRNIFLVTTKMFTSYKLTEKELILLGITLSFILTYLIH